MLTKHKPYKPDKGHKMKNTDLQKIKNWLTKNGYEFEVREETFKFLNHKGEVTRVITSVFVQDILLEYVNGESFKVKCIGWGWDIVHSHLKVVKILKPLLK